MRFLMLTCTRLGSCEGSWNEMVSVYTILTCHDRGIQKERLTEAFAPKAVGICAQTAVIGIGTRLAFAGTRAEAFPVEGIATVLALEQALQQIQGTPARSLPGMAFVLLPRLLNGHEHL